MSDFRIIRSCGSLLDLEKAIVAIGACQLHGGPFRDEQTREWCQAVTVRPEEAGEIRLKEPKKR